MRILALDHGDRRIGLAISDDEGRLAVPYGVLENRGRTYVLHELKVLLQREGVEKVLVGIPLPLNDERQSGEVRLKDVVNAQMQKVLRFIDDVRDSLPIPVETIDERLSTKEAERRAEGTPENVRAQKDALAATIILQSYLDMNHADNTGNHPPLP